MNSSSAQTSQTRVKEIEVIEEITDTPIGPVKPRVEIEEISDTPIGPVKPHVEKIRNEKEIDNIAVELKKDINYKDKNATRDLDFIINQWNSRGLPRIDKLGRRNLEQFNGRIFILRDRYSDVFDDFIIKAIKNRAREDFVLLKNPNCRSIEWLFSDQIENGKSIYKIEKVYNGDYNNEPKDEYVSDKSIQGTRRFNQFSYDLLPSGERKWLTPEEKQKRFEEAASKIRPEEDQMVEYMEKRKLKMA